MLISSIEIVNKLILWYLYPFGDVLEDFDRKTAGSRIGRRMRAIRTEEELSQSELGEMVGLNANRIQQYENGAMYAFFEMETLYDLRLKEVDGQMCICFGESQNDIKVSTMNNTLSKSERTEKERAAHKL